MIRKMMTKSLLSKYFFIGLLLAAKSKADNGSCYNDLVTSFVPMTCSQNLYTQYHHILFPHECCYEIDLSLTYRYISSHNAVDIATALWGSNTLYFAGQNINDRNSESLIAEYFGMGPDTNMALSFTPHIENQITDIQFALAGAHWWMQVNFPIMYANWNVTDKCYTIPSLGYYDSGNLDGSSLSMVYEVPTAGLTPPAAQAYPITVNNDQVLVNQNNAGANNIWFANTQNVSAEGSFVSTITAQNNLQVAKGQESIATNTVTTINSIDSGFDTTTITEVQTIGSIPIGLYGQYINSNDINQGSLTMDLNVSTVTAAPTLENALEGNYPFGQFAGRIYNNFYIGANTAVSLADIPLMIGYDFLKEKDKHIGLYLKAVIPCGTSIDLPYLQNVFSPICGNGHHFEFGAGFSAHITPISDDCTSWSFYADGYLNAMFGSMQFRSLDLQGQPMSRYALAYEYSDNIFSSNKIVAVGDTNILYGEVNAARGECILEVVYANRCMQVGLGYAFAGQSGEQLGRCSCGTVSQDQYAIVGNALQNAFGIGSVISKDSPQPTTIDNGVINTALSGVDPYAIACNFYNLGPTNCASAIPQGQSSAMIYGTPTLASACQFTLPETPLANHNLMPAQILNRIFGSISYQWHDSLWSPEVVILGSYGTSPSGYTTAAYWDCGLRLGCYF